ncbi:MAG: hypothetical protein LKI53_02050 [Bacteroidales bacterium]|jgi:hypothetical protein|nr:hypothetical protein [Bacteroidales bacterium]
MMYYEEGSGWGGIILAILLLAASLYPDYAKSKKKRGSVRKAGNRPASDEGGNFLSRFMDALSDEMRPEDLRTKAVPQRHVEEDDELVRTRAEEKAERKEKEEIEDDGIAAFKDPHIDFDYNDPASTVNVQPERARDLKEKMKTEKRYLVLFSSIFDPKF